MSTQKLSNGQYETYVLPWVKLVCFNKLDPVLKYVTYMKFSWKEWRFEFVTKHNINYRFINKRKSFIVATDQCQRIRYVLDLHFGCTPDPSS